MGIGSTYPFGELAANSSNAFGIARQGDIQAGAKRQINHYSPRLWLRLDNRGLRRQYLWGLFRRRSLQRWIHL
jgi:hypothetical protein